MLWCRSFYLLFICQLILVAGCRSDFGNSYAIKDFRSSLQPTLVRIASKGIVMSGDSSLENEITNNELRELCQSEQPVLRGSAFRTMLKRKLFDQFDLVMNHLDDTANIKVDMGEFGIWNRTVSDDLLQKARWPSQDAKDKTVDLVFREHNNLQSAYEILLILEPQERYYRYIKDMAIRPRHLTEDGFEYGFSDIETAMYGLAKFKKASDINVISERMTKNFRRLSHISLRLIKEFPDTAYFKILKRYYYRDFYSFNGNRRGGFTGYSVGRADPEDLIQAVAAQQTKESADLLDSMLINIPLATCLPDKNGIEDQLVRTIWQNNCSAYKEIRKKIKWRAIELNKGELKIELGPTYKARLDSISKEQNKIIMWNS